MDATTFRTEIAAFVALRDSNAISAPEFFHRVEAAVLQLDDEAIYADADGDLLPGEAVELVDQADRGVIGHGEFFALVEAATLR